MKKDYYIEIESLLCNVLSIKSKITTIPLKQVQTSLRELDRIYEYCFNKMNGRVVCVISTSKLYGAYELFPEFFNIRSDNHNIEVNQSMRHIFRSQVRAIFQMPKEIKDLIVEYFKNKQSP